MISERKDTVNAVYCSDPATWRQWLEENQSLEKNVWLIIYKKGHLMAGLTYDLAVNEALCFGWIDSKPNKRDADSFYQFFAGRNPKSNWSKVNKEKAARLIEAVKMTESGFASIQIAKQNGCWIALDKVENLKIPEEMVLALEMNEPAGIHWNGFPRSAKRGILEWIYNAKTTETRRKRIQETVFLAQENRRALQYQPKGKE